MRLKYRISSILLSHAKHQKSKMFVAFDFNQFQKEIFKETFGDPHQKAPETKHFSQEYINNLLKSTENEKKLKKHQRELKKKIAEIKTVEKINLKEKFVRNQSRKGFKKEIKEARVENAQVEVKLVSPVVIKEPEVNILEKKIHLKRKVIQKAPIEVKLIVEETPKVRGRPSGSSKKKPSISPRSKEVENIYSKFPQKLLSVKTELVVKMTRFELYLKKKETEKEGKKNSARRCLRLSTLQKEANKTETDKTIVVEIVDKENSEIESQEEFLNFLNLARN